MGFSIRIEGTVTGTHLLSQWSLELCVQATGTGNTQVTVVCSPARPPQAYIYDTAKKTIEMS